MIRLLPDVGGSSGLIVSEVLEDGIFFFFFNHGFGGKGFFFGFSSVLVLLSTLFFSSLAFFSSDFGETAVSLTSL